MYMKHNLVPHFVEPVYEQSYRSLLSRMMTCVNCFVSLSFLKLITGLYLLFLYFFNWWIFASENWEIHTCLLGKKVLFLHWEWGRWTPPILENREPWTEYTVTVKTAQSDTIYSENSLIWQNIQWKLPNLTEYTVKTP
jgi:hypothetical protein